MAFRTNKTPVLQTKSASGSVATFNTALAMPLKSCVSQISGYQEGSGTPSPSNPRALNGWTSANIAISDEDLYHDITVENGYLDTSGNVKASVLSSVTEYIPVVEGLVYYSYDYATVNLGPRNICIYDDSKQFVSCITYETVNKKAYFTIPSTGAYIRITIDRNYIDQHLYNGTTATINFGSTIYGGEYDARTGVLTVTHGYLDLGTLTWGYSSSVFNSSVISTLNAPTNNIICSSYETVPYNISSANMPDLSIKCYGGIENRIIYIKDSNYTDPAVFKTNMSGVQLVYELATPTTIQLPPCSIDTLEGVNNIWADTGDVDLTYKDLDIAKRGNFREVFRLPS